MVGKIGVVGELMDKVFVGTGTGIFTLVLLHGYIYTGMGRVLYSWYWKLG